jgi:hypothetical protein
LKTKPADAMLRFCFVVIAILYNYTEASFYGINNMWVMLLLGSLDTSEVCVDPLPTPAGQPVRTGRTAYAPFQSAPRHGRAV